MRYISWLIIVPLGLLVFACSSGKEIKSVQFTELVESPDSDFLCNSNEVTVSKQEESILNKIKTIKELNTKGISFRQFDSLRVLRKRVQNEFEGLIVEVNEFTRWNVNTKSIEEAVLMVDSIKTAQEGRVTKYLERKRDSLELPPVKLKQNIKLIKYFEENSISEFSNHSGIELIREQQRFRFNPETVINCDPVYGHTRIFKESWFVTDFGKYRKKKQYDVDDPVAYEMIDTKDFTVYRYRVKESDSIPKPCNLQHAHKLIEEKLKDSPDKPTENTDMIIYHHGLGMWMRNNWGLWSGKSHLIPYFHAKKITHADNMSSFILDTYHHQKFKVDSASMDTYYEEIGDLKCETSEL